MTYHTTAKGLAALGRNGDSMLMHVNPREVEALSKILGPTTTNPKTGLPEAYGWSNLLGSLVTGTGSFGIGAALEPIVSGMAGEGLMGEILSKAVPALTGAGIGAVVGGVTGGKAGAMGGAMQGAMSGGIGAYASEDLLPQAAETQKFSPAVKASEYGARTPSELPLTEAGGFGYKTPATKDVFGEIGAGLEDPAEGIASTIDKTANTSGDFFGNLSQIGKKVMSKEGFKTMEDYASPLLTAGMIGQGIESSYNAEDEAKKAEERMRQYRQQQQLAAQQFAQSTYGYADGGPVQFQTKGPLPVSVNIPEHAVEATKQAGGLGSFISFANGGYINTAPFNPDQFHPQARIPSAQPYVAASPVRAEVVDQYGAMYAAGGLLDGEGDGMSDDIDADIDGEEPVRVADGEFVVPKHIVDMLGVERLDELLKSVRRAAYGREEQINEDAGMEAARAELGV